MKSQKGITLVALIITIIVMLILVAVTVAVVVNSDIIGTAEDAADKYNSADDGLQNYSKENIINPTTGGNKTMDDYLEATNKNKGA